MADLEFQISDDKSLDVLFAEKVLPFDEISIVRKRPFVKPVRLGRLSFNVGELWCSPSKRFYRVTSYRESPGQRQKAVLRAGLSGHGRAIALDKYATWKWKRVWEPVIKEEESAELKYHLALPSRWTAMCGSKVRFKAIPAQLWGTSSETSAHWCSVCAEHCELSLAAIGVSVSLRKIA